MTPIAQGMALCALVWILWNLYRRFIARTALDNIPGPPPTSLWKGSLPQFFDRHGWNFHRELGEKYGSVVALTGFFGSKFLYVYDPKALHTVCVKEQNVYEETEGFLVANRVLFGEGLLATIGDHHRQQRKLLNPVFSINHMRHILPIFYNVTDKLQSAMASRLNGKAQEIDMSSWMSRVALELIGQGGLGHSFDPLVEDVVNPYATAIKALPATLFEMESLRSTLPYLYKLFPQWMLRWVVQVLPSRRLQRAREISDVMWDTSLEILASKRAALAAGDEAVAQQAGEGNDILSVLMKENSKADEGDKMSDEELVGHMSTLTSAATDTTSSALTRTLYMLAQHPDVQTKLRKEIQEARIDGQRMSYDDLVSLPYMDAVCRETLRLYAPVPYMTRETRKDAMLPLSAPIKGKDGQLLSEIPVPADTLIVVGIMACNRTQALWGEDAHEWKPERWLSPLPESIAEAHIPGIYSNLMTFLGGGRACIGFKFSQLEMKVVLATLLENFTFELSPDKDIYWNFAGIIYPTVGPVDAKMQLPLRVGLVKL